MKKLISIFACSIAFAACARGSSTPLNSPKERKVSIFETIQKKIPTAPIEIKKDPRTQDQLALSSCRGGVDGWRCKSVKEPKAMSANNFTVPTSWTVPDWFIDGANVSGCASDLNSGTSATCVGGCSAGVCTSGIGPLATYGELNSHRWDCGGNPMACPSLQQSTEIHVISSMSDLDPVMFTGAIEGPYAFSFVGTPVPICSGVLGSITAKNRGPSVVHLLQANGIQCAGAGALVTNATHPSEAFVSVSATSSTLTQPLTAPSGIQVQFPTEVNTWTIGDTFHAYSFPLVYLKLFRPVFGDSVGTIAGPMTWIQNIHIADSSGVSGTSSVHFDYTATGPSNNSSLGTNYLWSNRIDPEIDMLSKSSFLINNFSIGGGSLDVLGVQSSAYSYMAGGQFGSLSGTKNNAFGGSGNLAIISDAMIYGDGVNFSSASTLVDTAYVTSSNSGADITIGPVGSFFVDTALWGPAGPRQLTVSGTAKVSYQYNAGTAVSSFLIGYPMSINNSSAACLLDPTSGAGISTCLLSITPVQLDLSLGGLSQGGCFIAGGASICNTDGF